jgi:lycopene beta-cyclase
LDFAIVGGGLQGALLALALRGRRLALIERNGSLGGNHLWSFHAGDVPAAARPWIEPLVVARWPAYRVAFPDRVRVIEEEYASISSRRIDQIVRTSLGDAVFLRTEALKMTAHAVELADGRMLRARQVIDCRGPAALPLEGAHAFQKFSGVELRGSHGVTLPTLIDARVEQRDGFRFIYHLPLATDRLLVEDTRFSTDFTFDAQAVEADALRWARSAGFQGEVLRRESGVLPLPLERLPQFGTRSPLRAGYGGGFFHPVTGYSLPLAVRLALRIAAGDLDARWLGQVRAQQRFGLLLNRLLYRATPAKERWRVLSRFHGLSAATIRRFYALESTRGDRARILCGRPPRGVSLRRALEALA